MKYNFKEDFRKGLQPNLITTVGLLTVPAIINFHAKGMFVIAVILMAIAWFCDFLDGWWARRFKMNSKIGDFYDPLADKAVTWSLLIALWERVPSTAAVIIISFGLFATVGRVIVLVTGKKLSIPTNVMANYAGKIKTNFEKGGITALLLLDLFLRYWPRLQTEDFFYTLMMIGLWGSIPLGFISLLQMGKKLLVLYRSYA
jgi:CDP-diacylglycerol---glycerol-3-phosphate 3-phosphatidyltransferase